MYSEDLWLFALILLKKNKKAKAEFLYCYCKDWYYMNHHKTGNPQNMRLYAESEGSTLQVAGSGWSNPVYGIERK